MRATESCYLQYQVMAFRNIHLFSVDITSSRVQHLTNMCLNIKLIPLFMLLVMSLKNCRGHCKHEIKDEAYHHHLHSVSSKQNAVFEGNSRRTYKCIFLAFYHHWIWLIFDYMSFSHVFQVLSVFLEYFSSTFCTQIFFPGLKLFSKQMYFLLIFICQIFVFS